MNSRCRRFAASTGAFLTLATCTVAGAKTMRMDADFNAIGSAIKIYQLNTRQLPPAELGLQALVIRPESLPEGARWTKIMDRIPTDPWNRPYHYLAGNSFLHGFGIYSCGKDGVSATHGNDPDDWNSWSVHQTGSPEGPVARQTKILLLAVGLLALSFYLGRISARPGDPADLLSQG